MLEKPTKLVSENDFYFLLSGKGLQKLTQADSSVTKPKARQYSNYRAQLEDDRNGNKGGFKMRLFYIKANKHI